MLLWSELHIVCNDMCTFDHNNLMERYTRHIVLWSQQLLHGKIHIHTVGSDHSSLMETFDKFSWRYSGHSTYHKNLHQHKSILKFTNINLVGFPLPVGVPAKIMWDGCSKLKVKYLTTKTGTQYPLKQSCIVLENNELRKPCASSS